MRYQVTGLTEQETKAYIKHQLIVVETPYEIFSEEAIQAIHNFARVREKLILYVVKVF
nr:hypothetical protein [Anaerobacillus isosaccharinicus]